MDDVARTEEQFRSGNYKYIDDDVLDRINERERISRAKEDNQTLRLAIASRYALLSIGCIMVILNFPVYFAIPFFIPAVIAWIVAVFFPGKKARFKQEV